MMIFTFLTVSQPLSLSAASTGALQPVHWLKAGPTQHTCSSISYFYQREVTIADLSPVVEGAPDGVRQSAEHALAARGRGGAERVGQHGHGQLRS